MTTSANVRLRRLMSSSLGNLGIRLKSNLPNAVVAARDRQSLMRRPHLSELTRTLLFLLVCIALSGCISNWRKKAPQHIAKIAASRDYIEEKVRDLKHTPRLNAGDLKQGKDLYD